MYCPFGKDFLHFTSHILNGISNPRTLVLFENHVLLHLSLEILHWILRNLILHANMTFCLN